MRRATTAPSSTQREKMEMQSRALQAGTTPVVEKRPTVGLMPTQPQKCPGTLPVSRTSKFEPLLDARLMCKGTPYLHALVL